MWVAEKKQSIEIGPDVAQKPSFNFMAAVTICSDFGAQ